MTDVFVMGPWIGEFGHELQEWNPHARFLANNAFSDAYIVASGIIFEYILCR